MASHSLPPHPENVQYGSLVETPLSEARIFTWQSQPVAFPVSCEHVLAGTNEKHPVFQTQPCASVSVTSFQTEVVT